MRTKKIKFIEIVEIFLISAILSFTIFPFIQKINVKPLIIYNLFFILWMLLIFFKETTKFIKQPLYNYLVYLFLILVFIVPYSFGSNTIGNRYLDLSPIFYSFIISNYYLSKNKSYILKIILYIIAFFSLITLITTLLNLTKNPFITRIIKNYGYTKEYSISNNIGGYEFIYYSVLVFILLFYFLVNFYSKINKKTLVVLTIIIILIPLLVVMSNYFIAFLILVISIFLVLIFKFSKKNTYLKLFILFLSIILIYNFYTEKILDFFIDKTTGLNKIRFQELKDSYLESKEFNLETNRWQLYKVSFNTFLETPLLGVIGKEKELIFGTTTSSGQHSHFLDSLVYLGLFLSLLQLYVIFRPFFIYIKDKTFNDLVFTFLCSFLIIFLFNNLTPSMSIPLFFIFPYLYDKMLEMINYEKD